MLLYWDQNPIAFSLGPIQVHYYGLLFSIGFILGYYIMQYLCKKCGYKTNDLDKLLVYIFIGTIVGARLGHCFIYEPIYYLQNPLEIIKIWHGGLASHGGTVGVIIALLLYQRKSQFSFLDLTDLLSIPVSLVACFIRIGNFMNSEILGKPTNSDFGVVFLRLNEYFPRYPAQLFEAFAYLITFFILLLVFFKFKNKIKGLIFSLLLILIFSTRLIIEGFKEEQAMYDTHVFLNVGQLLSLPFILIGIILLIYSLKKAKRS